MGYPLKAPDNLLLFYRCCWLLFCIVFFYGGTLTFILSRWFRAPTNKKSFKMNIQILEKPSEMHLNEVQYLTILIANMSKMGISNSSIKAMAQRIIIKKNSPTTLRHLHFENLSDYQDGLRIQDKFVKANLDFKRIQTKIHKAIQQIADGSYHSAEIQKAKELGATPIMSSYESDMLHKILEDLKPTPMLLTFEFNPVYTGGLREQHNDNSKYNFKDAAYYQTSRGGQVTYHGPGQMVAYSILDLKDYIYKNKALTPRCYVSQLEQAVISTLKKGRNYDDSTRFVFDIDAKRTENTGVWINDKLKIASLGIHVTRNVTSHGVAINVSTDLSYPNRFTMCGLPDTKTTSMKELGVDRASVKDVAYSYSKEFAELMGFERVEHMNVTVDTFEEINNAVE